MAYDDMAWGIDEITTPIMAEIEKTKVANILGTISEKLNYLIIQNASAITTTASDTEQNVVLSSEVSTTYGNDLLLKTFSPLISGTMRLKCALKMGDVYAEARIRIAENNTNNTYTKAVTSKTYKEEQKDFNITAGKTYSIFLIQDDNATSGIAYCNNLTLNYTINQPQSLLGL